MSIYKKEASMEEMNRMDRSACPSRSEIRSFFIHPTMKSVSE